MEFPTVSAAVFRLRLQSRGGGRSCIGILGCPESIRSCWSKSKARRSPSNRTIKSNCATRVPRTPTQPGSSRAAALRLPAPCVAEWTETEGPSGSACRASISIYQSICVRARCLLCRVADGAASGGHYELSAAYIVVLDPRNHRFGPRQVPGAWRRARLASPMHSDDSNQDSTRIRMHAAAAAHADSTMPLRLRSMLRAHAFLRVSCSYPPRRAPQVRICVQRRRI